MGSVSERVLLWAAAVVSGSVVVAGLVRLVLFLIASASAEVPVPDWVVVFAEERGAATLVAQDVLATTAGNTTADTLAVLAEVVDVVMVVVIAAIVTMLCVSLAKGAPFSRLLSRAMGAASIVLGVGTLAYQTLQSVAHSMLVAQLAESPGGEVLGDPSFSLDYDLLPIAGALVLALLATAFSRAAKLQDDITGLV